MASLIASVAFCLIHVIVVLAQPRCDDCSTFASKHISCDIPSKGKIKYLCGTDTPRVTQNAPDAPRNLIVESTVDPSTLHPSFKVSWNPPKGSSSQYLTGFEISFIPMRPNLVQPCHLLNLTVRLDPSDHDAVFTFPPKGCYIPGLVSETNYTIIVQSLPVVSREKGNVRTKATTKKYPDVPYKWTTEIMATLLPGGQLNVWFALAPDKYDFIYYEISLYPDGPKVVVKKPYNIHIFKDLCPKYGSRKYRVHVKPSLKNADEKMVCVDENGEEQNDCITTYSKYYNITFGSDICPAQHDFPMIEVIGGTCGAAIVLLVVIVSVLAVRWRKRKNSNPQYDPLHVADDTYGSTGQTIQNHDQIQQTSSNHGQVYQKENVQNARAENRGFEPEVEHGTISHSNGHVPRQRLDGVQGQQTENRFQSPSNADHSQWMEHPEDVLGGRPEHGFHTNNHPIEAEGVHSHNCRLETDHRGNDDKDEDFAFSEPSISPEEEEELYDTTERDYGPVSFEEFS